ncbi:MAG TPA: hypothetical protein V6C76_05275 [Drouetiella sp.]
MLDPNVRASVVPYYGPWTVLNNAGEVMTTAATQEEALRTARTNLPEGSILAIDAANCIVRLVIPTAIERQHTPPSGVVSATETLLETSEQD